MCGDPMYMYVCVDGGKPLVAAGGRQPADEF